MMGFLADLDGTLLDSEATHVKIEQDICREHGLVVPPEEWHKFIGMPMKDIFADVLRRFGGAESRWDEPTVEELVREKRRRYIEQAPLDVRFIPGAAEFLPRMRAGFKFTAVVTSGSSDMQQKMFEIFGLTRYFDEVVTGDDVKSHKPHPAPYRLAAAKMSVRPDQCYALEDSLHGVRSASAAGCWTLALATTEPNHRKLQEAGARHVFDDYLALRRFVGV